MADYLESLVLRSIGTAESVAPRVPALFEPPSPSEGPPVEPTPQDIDQEIKFEEISSAHGPPALLTPETPPLIVGEGSVPEFTEEPIEQVAESTPLPLLRPEQGTHRDIIPESIPPTPIITHPIEGRGSTPQPTENVTRPVDNGTSLKVQDSDRRESPALIPKTSPIPRPPERISRDDHVIEEPKMISPVVEGMSLREFPIRESDKITVKKSPGERDDRRAPSMRTPREDEISSHEESLPPTRPFMRNNPSGFEDHRVISPIGGITSREKDQVPQPIGVESPIIIRTLPSEPVTFRSSRAGIQPLVPVSPSPKTEVPDAARKLITLPVQGEPVREDQRILHRVIAFPPRVITTEPLFPTPDGSEVPMVHVTIGRIEIRAMNPSPPSTKEPPKPKITGLDEYLRRRRE